MSQFEINQRVLHVFLIGSKRYESLKIIGQDTRSFFAYIRESGDMFRAFEYDTEPDLGWMENDDDCFLGRFDFLAAVLNYKVWKAFSKLNMESVSFITISFEDDGEVVRDLLELMAKARINSRKLDDRYPYQVHNLQSLTEFCSTEGDLKYRLKLFGDVYDQINEIEHHIPQHLREDDPTKKHEDVQNLVMKDPTTANPQELYVRTDDEDIVAKEPDIDEIKIIIGDQTIIVPIKKNVAG